MKLAALGSVVLLLSVPASPQDRQLVLLAAHRAGRIEVFDPTTLTRIGSIGVLPLADGLSSRPDGEILYIREGLAPEFKGCCALYALNLGTRRMTWLVTPTSEVALSPDGRNVLTQRGNLREELGRGGAKEAIILSVAEAGDPNLKAAAVARPNATLRFHSSARRGRSDSHTWPMRSRAEPASDSVVLG